MKKLHDARFATQGLTFIVLGLLCHCVAHADSSPTKASCSLSGFWAGRADGNDDSSSGFKITFVQDGSKVRGKFKWLFDEDKLVTEEVVGTIDCKTLAFTLDSVSPTESGQRVHYKMELHPTSEYQQPEIVGTYACGKNCETKLKGYLQQGRKDRDE